MAIPRCATLRAVKTSWNAVISHWPGLRAYTRLYYRNVSADIYFIYIYKYAEWSVKNYRRKPSNFVTSFSQLHKIGPIHQFFGRYCDPSCLLIGLQCSDAFEVMWICNDCFISNFLENVVLKEFWKSASIWQVVCKLRWLTFLAHPVVYMYFYMSPRKRFFLVKMRKKKQARERNNRFNPVVNNMGLGTADSWYGTCSVVTLSSTPYIVAYVLLTVADMSADDCDWCGRQLAATRTLSLCHGALSL